MSDLNIELAVELGYQFPTTEMPLIIELVDAALPWLATRLAAQPISYDGYGEQTLQRDADVLWLRGGAA